jgi:hypothetical protein
VFGHDAQNPYELLWFWEMTVASWRCRPQLFHPHDENDHAHLEDDHPLHPLQGRGLLYNALNYVRHSEGIGYLNKDTLS